MSGSSCWWDPRRSRRRRRPDGQLRDEEFVDPIVLRLGVEPCSHGHYTKCVREAGYNHYNLADSTLYHIYISIYLAYDCWKLISVPILSYQRIMYNDPPVQGFFQLWMVTLSIQCIWTCGKNVGPVAFLVIITHICYEEKENNTTIDYVTKYYL